jgi:hypothetical protein
VKTINTLARHAAKSNSRQNTASSNGRQEYIESSIPKLPRGKLQLNAQNILVILGGKSYVRRRYRTTE